MTGKEALEEIKYLTLNEPSGYGVYSTQLKDTIHYFIIKKELDELAKYKRAFEILKPLIKVTDWNEYTLWQVSTRDKAKVLDKEEYELLEELMRDETENRN